MDADRLTDADLIERVARHDEAAFAELHRRVVRATLGLALRSLRREDAEQAAADASAAIRAAAPGFDPALDDADGWLFDVVRQSVGAGEVDADAYQPSWRAYRAIEALPAPERLAVELARWGGMSPAEIAAYLHRPEQEVEALLGAALARVAAAAGGDDAEGLLARVGPPPELPPELGSPPAAPVRTALPIPRRYRSTAFVAAVMLALVLFGVGYLVGAAGESRRQEVRAVELAGVGRAARATGEVRVFRADDAGNWPLELRASELPAPPPGRVYELRLVSAGGTERVVGSFTAAGAELEVSLTVPVAPAAGDRWQVVVVVDGAPEVVLQGPAS